MSRKRKTIDTTYSLLDVTIPLAPPPKPDIREQLRRAAAKAFAGMPWRGPADPPCSFR